MILRMAGCDGCGSSCGCHPSALLTILALVASLHAVDFWIGLSAPTPPTSEKKVFNQTTIIATKQNVSTAITRPEIETKPLLVRHEANAAAANPHRYPSGHSAANGGINLNLPTQKSEEKKTFTETTIKANFSAATQQREVETKPVLRTNDEDVRRRPARYPNVVLLGQFNVVPKRLDQVVDWVEKWSQDYFDRDLIHVFGPFDDDELAVLRQHLKNVHVSALEEAGTNASKVAYSGYYSPMKNLADTLRFYANSSNIQGVMTIHDDMIANMTYLDEIGFPDSKDLLTQVLPNVYEQPYLYFTTNYTFSFVGSLNNHYGAKIPSKAAYRELRTWRWWSECIPQYAHAVATDAIFLQNGTMPFFANGVSDFVYVPLQYASLYADLADWMARHGIFLECGTPSILGLLLLRQSAPNSTKIRFVEYANPFVKTRSEYATWVPNATRGENLGNWHFLLGHRARPPYGLYHPLKLSIYGSKTWNEHFDLINGNK